MRSVRVFAPASVANVGPGFDVLGFAVSGIGDSVIAKTTSEKGIRIKRIVGDNGVLPINPVLNTASIAAAGVMKKLGVEEGLELEIHKGMPMNSGLGSSGASAVAGAYAALKVFAKNSPKHFILEDCVKAEGKVSGFHADNVAPSIFGGFVVIRSYKPIDYSRFDAPEKLVSIVVTPDIAVSTKKARGILPKQIPLMTMVDNAGNLAALIAGLTQKDYSLIGRSVNDSIVEPVRAKLIPGFNLVKKTALEQGAMGCSIAGSGPTVFAFTDSKSKGESIARSMREAFAKKGLDSKSVVSFIDNRGARVLL